jgi:hypothetical protein
MIVSLLSMTLFAQGSMIVSPKKNCGVYQNHPRAMYETPVYTVEIDDRLCVIDQNTDYFKVQNVKGQSGWIAKNEVNVLKKNQKFTFNDAEVLGYLDNPTPVYILDADQDDKQPIKLDRSFSDNLKENVDRETIDRTAEGQ